MSWLSAPTTSNLGGMSTQQLATTQEGIALPWFCGIRRLPAHWITPASNRVSFDPGGDSESWFCRITAAFAYGPVDAILALYYNGRFNPGDRGSDGLEDLRLPVFRSEHPSYYDIAPGEFALNGRSMKKKLEQPAARLHWGLDPQPEWNRIIGEAASDPRYWRVCNIEWNQLYLGVNNPQRMPNIEALLVRGVRVPQGMNLPGSVDPDRRWGVNPVSALAEILTDVHVGAARPVESLHIPSWEDSAAALDDDRFRISPILDTFRSEDALIEEFLRYFDGYTFYEGGKLGIGFIPDNTTILVPENYPEFTSHDMTRAPVLKTSRPDETVNEIEATYIDPFDTQYKESAFKLTAPHNRTARGQPKLEHLDLKWKIGRDYAQAYVHRFLSHAAAVRQEGRIWVREDRAWYGGRPVRVGDVVFVDQSIAQMDQAYRVTGRKMAAFGEVELMVVTERGQYPLAYVAPEDPFPDPELPGVPGIEQVRIVELPWELSGFAGISIYPLMLRSNPGLSGVRMHLGDEAATTYRRLADFAPRHFASMGERVGANLPPEPEDPDDLIRFFVDLSDYEGIVNTTSPGEANNDTLICWEGDEIYSVMEVLAGEHPENPDLYLLVCKRARYNTRGVDHGETGELWFISPRVIEPVRDAEFGYGVTINYKLQGSNWAQAVPLENVANAQYTFSDASEWLPQITIALPQDSDGNGVIDMPPLAGASWLYIGESMPFVFSVTEPRGPNADVSLVSYAHGNDQENDSSQLAYKRWEQPAGQTDFLAPMEALALEWMAFTIYATNRYGTTSKTLWGYVNNTPLPTALLASGAHQRIDITWDKTDVEKLPHELRVQYFPLGNYAEQKVVTIRGDAISSGHHAIDIDTPGTWQVWIWAVRQVNGKEFISSPYGNNAVLVSVYPKVPAKGGAAIVFAPNPYQFIIYFDETRAVEDGFVAFQWFYDGEDPATSRFDAVPSSWGRMDVSVPKAGHIWVNVWQEDKRRNKGEGQWIMVEIVKYAPPAITSVDKPAPYELKLNFTANVYPWLQAWYWPNRADGFQERKWSTHVPGTDGSVTIKVDKNEPYAIRLYGIDEEQRWTRDPVAGGVGYTTQTPTIYPALPAAPGNAILNVFPSTNPYEFVLFWNGSTYRPGSGYLVFQWHPLGADPKATSQFNYCPIEWGQFNQKTTFAGPVIVYWWFEDTDSRKGELSYDNTKAIPFRAGTSGTKVSMQVSGGGTQATVSWTGASQKDDIEAIEVWDNSDTQLGRDTLWARLEHSQNSLNFPEDHFVTQEPYSVYVRVVYKDGQTSDWLEIAFDVPAADGQYTFWP